MKKKVIRKTIRIGGKTVTERFATKAAADAWYSEMFNLKKFNKHAIHAKIFSKVTLQQYYDETWLPRRKKEYGEATWSSDVQRMKDYVTPILGHFPMNSIRPGQIRFLLEMLVTEHGLSASTRDRVKVLISGIFSSAMNADPQIVESNPTMGLKFKSKRVGKHKPSHISNTKATIAFLKAAEECGPQHYVYAAICIMAGPRKQELIALKWDCVDFAGFIDFSRKYIQKTGQVVMGTKKGEETSRTVPIPKDLVTILLKHMNRPLKGPTKGFVLEAERGGHLTPSMVRKIHADICLKAKIKVTPHGLRHTFGREFAQRGNNLKALQEFLGHSSLSTTQIYSELGKDRLKEFGETLQLNITGDENGQSGTDTDME